MSDDRITKALFTLLPPPSTMITMVRIVMFPAGSENGVFLTWRQQDSHWKNFTESIFAALANPKIDYAYVEYLIGKTPYDVHTLKGTPHSPHLTKKQ
jgi:hypothetical protein